MLNAGVVTTCLYGLIDRFRDQLVFPITQNNHVLGFIGRRDPQRERIPKYLNTGDNPAASQGDQL